MPRIAVAGNPNTGKTTLFNALCGARAKVGNYPGVTVERREASVRSCWAKQRQLTLVDLPGCYSLTARSPEEDVAQRALLGDLGEAPCDLIICVLDATQLRRGLYLLLQLCELGLPVVVALTMVDSASRRGIQIETGKLAELLGVDVVAVHAASQQGLSKLVDTATKTPRRPRQRVLSVDPEGGSQLLTVAARLGESFLSAAADRRGLTLWLVTSRLEALTLTLDPPIKQAIIDAQKMLDGPTPGAFNRRVIAARFAAVDQLVEDIELHPGGQDIRSSQLDSVLLHPLWGSVLFMGMMGLLFQMVFAWAKPVMDLTQDSVASVASSLESVLPASQLRSLLVHGVLAGVGNVVAFVPQIFLLFVGLALLESSGYMARAAVLADRLMRRVGLHGRAFVPLLSSFACAIPGIMAARTLETRRDRLVTMLMAPLMSCSARLPVYTLVAAATLGGREPWLGFVYPGGLAILAMYVLGFVAALMTGRLLRGTLLRGEAPPLVADLPPYRLPRLADSIGRAAERAWAFVSGAGPTLLLLSVVLWGAMSYPQLPLDTRSAAPSTPSDVTAPVPLPASKGTAVEAAHESPGQTASVRASQLSHSVAGRLGHAIEPVIKPLGFDWRIGIGLLASIAAREVLVGTLAQVYALDATGDTDAAWPTLRDALAGEGPAACAGAAMTPLAGVSLMVFFAIALQCMSTVAILKRETGGWRWPVAALVYMNALAWLTSFVVYQGGQLILRSTA